MVWSERKSESWSETVTVAFTMHTNQIFSMEFQFDDSEEMRHGKDVSLSCCTLFQRVIVHSKIVIALNGDPKVSAH